MEYRLLGKTGLSVSILGFGASPLGNEFRQIDPAEGEYAVHEAVDQGINFFDVSPYYGRTLAETRLGAALAGRRNKVVLATKCGRYDSDSFDFSAARITASLDESLQRLRTDFVDLFQAHDIEFGDREQIINETIPAMRKLQEAGKARFIGITGLPLRVLLDVAERGGVDTILSYCRYNPLIRDLDERLTPFAEKHGIGLINASPLHMRILTASGPPDWHPAPAAVKEAGAKLVVLCEENGIDPAAFALRFCCDHPYVASTLVGLSNPGHVQQNLRALTFQIDAEFMAQANAIVEPVKNMTWWSGRPENND